MTREDFDKAIEINSNLNTIYEIKDVLRNSKNRLLAAIEAKKFNQSGTVVEECRVLNHVKVPEHIMEKFEKILIEEIEILNKEFKEL